LNAKVKMASVNGERTMELEDFTTDYFETELGHDELLTEILIPVMPPHSGAKYTKFSQITGDHATASVGMMITLDKNKETCSDVRIALGAESPAPMRPKKAEAILKGKKIDDALLVKAGQAASEECRPESDAEVSAEYKRDLVKVLVKRVGAEALERARKA
jgi:carbon-monoxide dehydrogenase medium subunit